MSIEQYTIITIPIIRLNYHRETGRKDCGPLWQFISELVQTEDQPSFYSTFHFVIAHSVLNMINHFLGHSISSDLDFLLDMDNCFGGQIFPVIICISGDAISMARELLLVGWKDCRCLTMTQTTARQS